MQAQLRETMFSSQDPLPRRTLRCVECAHEVDELTGVVVKLGNPADIDDPFDISGSQKK